MDIVVFEAEEWEADACARLGVQHHVQCTPDRLDQATAAGHADAAIATTFINSRLDAATLSLLPKLRMIATRSTGYDHIDLEFCATHNIVVCNVPSYGDVTVAEHVFTLLLALARNLVPTVEGVRAGRFDQSGLRGIDLYGKTIGVVGTGRIGRRVIAIAKGFGMNVLAADVQPDQALAAAEGFAYVDLAQLLRDADVISLNVPATAATRNLIGDGELALMKPDAILINTARGNVIDVDALVRAVTGGRLRAVGLDVLPQEPLMRDEAEIFRAPPADATSMREVLANHVLLASPKVLVTPHIAYNTIEARRRIIETTIDNIEAFAAGHPINLVGR